MSQTGINAYDFDHTVYHGDASLDFILYCLKRYPRSWLYLPLPAFSLAKYAFGRANRKQVKESAFAFLRGVKDIDATLVGFWASHEHKIKPWYLHQKHPSDLIISASPEFLLQLITEKLGIMPPIATIMDKHTGVISGENCRGDEKVRRLYDYDASITLNSCYSDSRSDLPLLRLARHAYLVKKHTVTLLPHDSIG